MLCLFTGYAQLVVVLLTKRYLTRSDGTRKCDERLDPDRQGVFVNPKLRTVPRMNRSGFFTAHTQADMNARNPLREVCEIFGAHSWRRALNAQRGMLDHVSLKVLRQRYVVYDRRVAIKHF